MSTAARRERGLDAARALGADGIASAHPATVAWLSGFAGDIEGGPSTFALPPLVVARPGEAALVVAAEEEEAALATGCDVVTYEGYVMDAPAPADRAAAAVAPLLRRGTWATELATLPAALAPLAAWRDAAQPLAQARAIKDADEIEQIRAAIALCDAGQAAARAHAVAGIAEIELWGAIRAAIERAAGGRVPVLADCAAGARTEETGGAPGEYVLREGDALICDLVPRRGAYWGDSCATLAVGEPPPRLREQHRRAREALERALELARPGARAAAIDDALRPALGYRHHTGHGVGAWFFEPPHIAPGSADVLAEGMVIALEPGVYGEGSGARVEQVAVIRAGGAELLSGHALGL